ncbi:MAG: metallophosphoesterase [Polyangiales bacterium]
MNRFFATCLALALALPIVASAQARTPYLQTLTPTSVTVVFRTAGAGRGRVCFGEAPDALGAPVLGTDGATQHVIRLGALRPATRYWYAATTDATCPARAEDGDTFRTPPTPGTVEPLRLWVVGDSGTGGSAQRAVRDAMLAYVGDAMPDLFLHVGDMAYDDGTDAEFSGGFFGPYADILRRTPVWPAIGNHEAHTSDSGSESGPYYQSYVLPRAGEAGGVPSGTEAWYSFDHANVHFIVLDSADSSRSVGSPMLTWLEEDLAATDATWVVAFWHHPPYTKGSHDSDTESTHVQMRQNVLPILETWDVDVVLGGHSHIYERSFLVQGAYDTPTTAAGHILDPGDGRVEGDGPYDLAGPGSVYVVAGHGGAGVSGDADHPLMFFSEVDYGSVIVDVEGDVMTLTNVRRDGEVTDTATLVKGEGVHVLAPRGGERLPLARPYDVRWTAPAGGTADLDVSYDDGATWAAIAAGEANDGAFTWTPTVPGERVRLRVAVGAASDESGTFAIAAESDLELIPFGGAWEYSDGAAAPDAAWRTTTGGWPSGDAELGYGDGDEVTTLLDADPNVPTVYFRRAITIEGDVLSATLDVLYDDAIAVWIDDRRVASVNVGDEAHDAFATAASSDDETMSFDLDPSVFRRGTIVVAALVKQANASSSDLSFDLRLRARVRADVPEVDGGVAPRPDGSTPTEDGGSTTPPRDGGSTEEGGGGGGCGCSAGGDPVSAPLLGLWWAIRRRRRRLEGR